MRLGTCAAMASIETENQSGPASESPMRWLKVLTSARSALDSPSEAACYRGSFSALKFSSKIWGSVYLLSLAGAASSPAKVAGASDLSQPLDERKPPMGRGLLLAQQEATPAPMLRQ